MKDLIILVLMQIPSIISISFAGVLAYQGQRVGLSVLFLLIGGAVCVTHSRID